MSIGINLWIAANCCLFVFVQGQQIDQMIMGMDDISGDLDDKLGSFDEGDPQTTNLYVGNLAPQVKLHDHTLLFGTGPRRSFGYCLQLPTIFLSPVFVL